MKTEQEIMVWASGFYLTEHLPFNYETYDDDVRIESDRLGDDEELSVEYETIDEFVEGNAWEPFEYWDAKNIWTQISGLASSAKSFFQEGEVK